MNQIVEYFRIQIENRFKMENKNHSLLPKQSIFCASKRYNFLPQYCKSHFKQSYTISHDWLSHIECNVRWYNMIEQNMILFFKLLKHIPLSQTAVQ